MKITTQDASSAANIVAPDMLSENDRIAAILMIELHGVFDHFPTFKAHQGHGHVQTLPGIAFKHGFNTAGIDGMKNGNEAATPLLLAARK